VVNSVVWDFVVIKPRIANQIGVKEVSTFYYANYNGIAQSREPAGSNVPRQIAVNIGINQAIASIVYMVPLRADIQIIWNRFAWIAIVVKLYIAYFSIGFEFLQKNSFVNHFGIELQSINIHRFREQVAELNTCWYISLESIFGNHLPGRRIS